MGISSSCLANKVSGRLATKIPTKPGKKIHQHYSSAMLLVIKWLTCQALIQTKKKKSLLNMCSHPHLSPLVSILTFSTAV